jgi:hypothetical protein
MLLAFDAKAIAQDRDVLNQRKDTGNYQADTLKTNKSDTAIVPKFVKKDSFQNTIIQKKIVAPLTDTNSKINANQNSGNNDLLFSQSDTAKISNSDKSAYSGSNTVYTKTTTSKVLAENRFINSKDEGTYFLQEIRIYYGKEFTFYLICILLFILAVFKSFYPMYFNNLFRIFFNTSLRQTQLTDQLSQAKFPSFVLNIFFALSGGVYIWLLFNYFNRVQSIQSHTLLLICILSVASIYLIKFFILKFTGWIAGIKSTIDNYIFVIFLVNKIMGVLLLPFIVFLAFSMNKWIPSIAAISALFIGLLFLSRYAKSYGILEKKLNINSLHLFIFVVGAEIVPLLIIYKVAVDYLV